MNSSITRALAFGTVLAFSGVALANTATSVASPRSEGSAPAPSKSKAEKQSAKEKANCKHDAKHPCKASEPKSERATQAH